MNRKKSKKSESEKAAATPAAAGSTIVELPPDEPCPPDMVLQAALGEPIKRPLANYHNAIRVLRNEKKFTFREIAEWLRQFNVTADHNAVYREYTKAMPEEIARDEEIKDALMEEQERP